MYLIHINLPKNDKGNTMLSDKLCWLVGSVFSD